MKIGNTALATTENKMHLSTKITKTKSLIKNIIYKNKIFLNKSQN